MNPANPLTAAVIGAEGEKNWASRVAPKIGAAASWWLQSNREEMWVPMGACPFRGTERISEL